MRVLVILVLSGTLGVLGCDSSSGGSGGTAGAGGTAGSAGAGGEAGGGGEGGDGGAGGEAGGGGEGGGGGTVSAAQFCDGFEDTCSYGDPNYSDREACLSSYEAYPASRQGCVIEHLGNAAGAPAGDVRDAHCGHASGLPPCG